MSIVNKMQLKQVSQNTSLLHCSQNQFSVSPHKQKQQFSQNLNVQKRVIRQKKFQILDSGLNQVSQLSDSFEAINLAPIFLSGIAISLVTLGLIRAYLYVQIQIEKTKILSYAVPKGAAVIQLGETGRELYYYPQVKSIACIDPNQSQEYVIQSAIKAGVNAVPNKAKVEDISLRDENSADCVVLLSCLQKVSDIEQLVKGLSKVLKPNSRFIVIQRVKSGFLSGIFGANNKNSCGQEVIQSLKNHPMVELELIPFFENTDLYLFGYGTAQKELSRERRQKQKEEKSKEKQQNKDSRKKSGFAS